MISEYIFHLTYIWQQIVSLKFKNIFILSVYIYRTDMQFNLIFCFEILLLIRNLTLFFINIERNYTE